VRTVLDPATIRHIVIPHFEGDECGGLNLFLEAAPHAQPVCSPTGAATSIPDFAIREPLKVDETTVLDLGAHKLSFLITPYVHAWDSLLAYDETTRTLFSSDLFLQPGRGPALTERDTSEEMIDYTRSIGVFPSQAHLVAALDKIDLLQPQTLACHHGTVKAGHIATYLAAFRHHDVTGLVPSDPVHTSIAMPPSDGPPGTAESHP
jgi:flavorubredoxin